VKIEQNSDAPSFEKISACVHCGLCLEACPTYRELRVEMDSPRGRIYLMKGILNERIEPTEEVMGHLDQCLDCRACETACPSGVEYGSILEKTRTLLEPTRSHGLIVKFLRWFLFRKLLPNRKLQQVIFKLLWVQQILGITAIGRILGRKGWLPGKLGAMAAQSPASRSTRSADGTRRSSTSSKASSPFKAPKGTRRSAWRSSPAASPTSSSPTSTRPR
jgi:glycolate oxidase iron-sulfur subunit